jgi:Fic family protein
MAEIYNLILDKWQKEKIFTESDIDRILHNFRILFAYHSGKIENDKIDYHDTHEIFENGKISSFTGDIRTLFEQKNQKDCYEFLRPKLAQREPLSLELIKQVHFELTKGTYDERRYIANKERPGEFKKHDYVVGRYDVGSAADEVEKELSELIDELNSTEIKDVLKATAYFHGVFENIHPFADGNGRVGRTLMNYYLILNNHPPLVAHEERRGEYYEALDAFHLKEDIEPLTVYLKSECIQTWKQPFNLSTNQNSEDFQSTAPIRCYPFPSGQIIEQGNVLIKLPPLDPSMPITLKQPIKISKTSVKLRTDSTGTFVIEASTSLIDKVAALKQNVHIPIKQK